MKRKSLKYDGSDKIALICEAYKFDRFVCNLRVIYDVIFVYLQLVCFREYVEPFERY